MVSIIVPSAKTKGIGAVGDLDARIILTVPAQAGWHGHGFSRIPQGRAQGIEAADSFHPIVGFADGTHDLARRLIFDRKPPADHVTFVADGYGYVKAILQPVPVRGNIDSAAIRHRQLRLDDRRRPVPEAEAQGGAGAHRIQGVVKRGDRRSDAEARVLIASTSEPESLIQADGTEDA